MECEDSAVEISAKTDFHGGDEFPLDLELRDERTSDRGTKTLRAIHSLKDCLRTLGQTFAFFIELTQNFESRSLFRQRPLDVSQILFRPGEKILLSLQIFFGCL